MKHRLFIGITLPPDISDAVVALQSRLDTLGLPLRHEEREKLHITLNFLGRVEDEKLPAVKRLMAEAADITSSFELTPYYLDCMYKKHSDSFVYIGLSGQLQDLTQLERTLSRPLSRLSIPQPGRYFPHITVSRFKKADPVFIKSAMDRVADLVFSPFPPFRVESFALFESLLSAKGSHFRRIGQVGLK